MGFLSYFTAVFLGVYAAILAANTTLWLSMHFHHKWKKHRARCEMCGSKDKLGVEASLSSDGIKQIVLCAACHREEGEIQP